MYECGNAFLQNFGNELTFAFNLKRNKIIGTQYFENKPICEMHVSISNFEQNTTFKIRIIFILIYMMICKIIPIALWRMKNMYSMCLACNFKRCI